jgi:hypothetical protein
MSSARSTVTRTTNDRPEEGAMSGRYTALVTSDEDRAYLAQFTTGIAARTTEQLRADYRTWKWAFDALHDKEATKDSKPEAVERAINLCGAYLEAIQTFGKSRAASATPTPYAHCGRHGTPLENGSCWECEAERDIQAREAQEDREVAEFKMRRDESERLRTERHAREKAARTPSWFQEPEIGVKPGWCPRHDEPLIKGTSKCWECELITAPTSATVSKPAEQQVRTAEEVPAGSYALPAQDGHVVFYDVDRPQEGKWAGRVFVSQLIGAPGSWREEPIRGKAGISVLHRISEFGTMKALALFGEKARRCGACHSPLSNIQSRAAGYGETCAGNRGYFYPTESEARAILQERGIDPDEPWDDTLFDTD